MLPLNVLLALVAVHVSAVRRTIRRGGDRGTGVVEMAIMVGLFAAAAIIIVGILVAKAKTAANNVQTQ